LDAVVEALRAVEDQLDLVEIKRALGVAEVVVFRRVGRRGANRAVDGDAAGVDGLRGKRGAHDGQGGQVRTRAMLTQGFGLVHGKFDSPPLNGPPPRFFKKSRPDIFRPALNY